MPYSCVQKENVIYYTVTTPNWFCEWIVAKEDPVKRQCYLKNSILNILESNDLKEINDLLPEIVNEIDIAISEWIKQGDINASSLLSARNIPAYLAYAKQALLSDINR